MVFYVKHFVRRLGREGVRSFSIPLVALVFVVLINLLGAVRAQLQEQYDDVMDNLPIVARISDLSGTNVDNLFLRYRILDLFTDPDVPLSLYAYTDNLSLRRSLVITDIEGMGSEGIIEDADVLAGEAGQESASIHIIGITDVVGLYPLTENSDFNIYYFDGFDESFFADVEPNFVVSESLLPYVEDNLINVSFRSNNPQVTAAALIDTIDSTLNIVGVVSGVDNHVVLGPFWAVTEMGMESDGRPYYSELLSMTVANNHRLSRFKSVASQTFTRVRPVASARQFAMNIYDSDFFETIESLRQNIILVDVATPFIFTIAVAVGFLTATLLTRQRLSEYAIMRSMGVRRRGIFLAALFEQAFLSLVGAVIGIVLVSFTVHYTSFDGAAVFLLCYVVGAMLSVTRALGSDVMALLRHSD